jgi:type IV secretion system protein VirB9
MTVHYGYQSSIELHPKEKLKTLSLGNSYSWKITPTDGRIFIKALEGNAHTNMTIITNKRTYQFELQSRNPAEITDEELVYVVRFYYPDGSIDLPRPQITTKRYLPPELLTKPVYNFNYTLTGPDVIAPIKAFDDGKKTYLLFANNNALIPHLFARMPNGQEQRVSYTRKAEYVVIDAIVPELILRLDHHIVNIYNESNKPQGVL